MSYDVFISYSKEDLLIAGSVCQALEAAGIRCWMAPRDIQEGENWTAAIMHGITQCRAMVLVFSGHTNLSLHVHREVGHAFNRGLTVIPFRIEDKEAEEKLLYYLDSVQWLNAFPRPVEEYFSRLAERVIALLARIPLPQTAPAPGPKSEDNAQAAQPVAPGPGRSPAAVSAEPGPPSRPGVSPRSDGEARDHEVPFPKPQSSNLVRLFLVAAVVALTASAGTILFLNLGGGSKREKIETQSAGLASPPRDNAPATPSSVTVPLALVQATTPPVASVAPPEPTRAPPATPSESASNQSTIKRGTDFSNSLGQRMVWIEPLGFWVAAHETTQAQFQQIMKANPSDKAFRGPQRPVDSVTWYDAVRYCDVLTDTERKAGNLPAGFEYRLPKDREWSVFAEGAEVSEAVHERSKSQGTADVGSRAPNRYGLSDILGNVWEWCSDDFDPSLNSAAVRAQLHDLARDGKVLRGGSWSSSSSSVMLRRDTRGSDRPGELHNTDGFRVVLAPTL